MSGEEPIKVAFTLAEAMALAGEMDREHWSDFPEVIAAYDVLASGKFEFTLEEVDALLTTLDPDEALDDEAYVSGAVRLRQAKADHLGWEVGFVNRTLGWSV